MTTLKQRCLLALLSAALIAPTAAWAQSASPAKPAMTAEQKKAKSKECSAQADKQGLHGKARKVFRSKCKLGET